MTPGECADAFGRAAVRAGSLIPVLDDFAVWMQASIQKNFDVSGRPTTWPETKYPPPNHKATLVNEGDLLRSATAFRDGNTDIVLAAGGGGQRSQKAPSLQYGAELNMRRHRASGRFAKKRARKDISEGDVIGYGVLPPRPYLLFQDEDLDLLGTKLPDFIFMVIK